MWFEILLLLVLLLGFLDYLWKCEINSKLTKRPGPLNLPIIGSMWMYFGRKPDELLALSQDLRQRYGRTVNSWILHVPGCFTSDLDIIQEVLSHPTEIKKNRMYWLLTDWLGDGLLMSYGRKWLARRRVITPTFHFAILEQFVQIFDRQATIMCRKLERYAAGATDAAERQGEGKEQTVDIIDVHSYVALATLDVICETAMGVQINAQTAETQCEYVRLLLEMTAIILKRFVNMPYRNDFVFGLFAPKLAKRQRAVMAALHGFTERIIEERRREMLQKSTTTGTDANMDLGIKPRLALLDVLLSSTIDGQPLSNTDIREEVDTFMFEGHDTTKSGIGFTLYCISREPEVQRKLYAEILEVLGRHDNNKELSQRALMELKYTEKVIKEALRMYPPVPFIGRQLQQDCFVNGNCLPKGVSIVMALITMQNDPEYFPEPARFLPERVAHENAFAFVPFSAGPRNCIGQRFAMLEMKAFVARIVQRFELLPLGDAVIPTVNVVLNSKTGWQMGFRCRR